MAMTDDERLIEMTARIDFDLIPGLRWAVPSISPETREVFREKAKDRIRAYRAEGITLTPPPAPEPTYTRTFTDAEWNVVVFALNELRFNEDAIVGLRNRADLLFAEIRNIEPDPEPGA